jgi:hypothetical protein
MSLAIRIALFALLLVATGAIALGTWGAFVLNRHLIVAIDGIGSASMDSSAILHRIDGPAGTVVEIDKLLLALKSTTVHADMMIAHEDKQLDVYDSYISTMADDIHDVSARLGGTADAATGTARSATAAIDTANRTIASGQPLIESATSRINDPRIDRLMDSLNVTSTSVAGITADSKRVADDMTAQYFKKVPWWKEPGKWYRLGIDAATLAK